MVLICVFPMVSDNECLFMSYWSFLYLLLKKTQNFKKRKNIYLRPSAIKKKNEVHISSLKMLWKISEIWVLQNPGSEDTVRSEWNGAGRREDGAEKREMEKKLEKSDVRSLVHLVHGFVSQPTNCFSAIRKTCICWIDSAEECWD